MSGMMNSFPPPNRKSFAPFRSGTNSQYTFHSLREYSSQALAPSRRLITPRMAHAIWSTVRPTQTSRPGELDPDELSIVRKTFRKYARADGRPLTVSRVQLQQMMTDLNDGAEPPTDGEVDFVMTACDINGSGDLDEAQFIKAITLWYIELEDLDDVSAVAADDDECVEANGDTKQTEEKKKETDSKSGGKTTGCCVVC
eukprot:PhM_4_TR6306/c0_g1_i2/m.105185